MNDFEKTSKTRSADEDRNDTFVKDGSNILELLGMVEPGDDASSDENDAEDLSNSSSDGEDSDAEDVFQLNAMKIKDLEKPYTSFFPTPMATSNGEGDANGALGCVASFASGFWSPWENMEPGGQSYCPSIMALCLCPLYSLQCFLGH